MRILHLLKSNRFSGAESVAIQIMEAFRGETGYEMTYVSPDGPIREVLKERGLSCFPMQEFSGAELGRILSEYRPDLLHAHDFSASVLAARTFRGRIISHLHNNPPWIQKCNPKTIAYHLVSRRFERILTVSPAIGKEFWRHQTLEKKILVPGNPFDAEEIRKKAGEQSRPKTDLLFLGRLTEQKNPLLFVKITAELSQRKPDLSAVMIGEGELQKAVEEEIRMRGLTERIRLTGFVENPYPYLTTGRVLVMPSRYEGFGLAALEAMALSKPVVCSGAGGLSGLVDSSCGAICTTDESYVQELEKLLSDEEYYQKKADGAKLRAEERSNIGSYRETLRKVYENPLTKRRENINA